MIRENGGWDAFDMKPIKEFPCENKTQLLIEEERIRNEMHANLNANKAFRTQEERKEYQKEYNHQNIVKEYQKEYRQQHREQIVERQKEYRNKNRDNVNQKRREKYKESKLS
jgi:hypothetical protein